VCYAAGGLTGAGSLWLLSLWLLLWVKMMTAIDRKTLWLAGMLLTAGCSGGCTSPAEQAKAAKFEQMYITAQDQIDVLENQLNEAQGTLNKRRLELAQVMTVLEQERQLHESEMNELKATIEALKAELVIARKGKDADTKAVNATPAKGEPEKGEPEKGEPEKGEPEKGEPEKKEPGE
jgi:hypothetical protein